jgi:hypothetical protein
MASNQSGVSPPSRGRPSIQAIDDGRTALPSIFSNSTAGRNMFSGPGLSNTNISLVRSFRTSERLGQVRFRSEFFNFFNQVNFGQPDGNSPTRPSGRFKPPPTRAFCNSPCGINSDLRKSEDDLQPRLLVGGIAETA